MNTYQLEGGLLLTFDQEDKIKMEGKIIHIRPVWKWLLEKGKSSKQ
jgi:quercetin dioxygenase-like cupin family protein